jgi:NADH:ubiquinone reductase (H+-translocating)
MDLQNKPLPVVVGAGYAGVLCANRLARRSGAPVLLVAPSDSLVHRVRLHETAARGSSSLVPLAGLLHPRVRHVQASATGLDTAAHTLSLSDRRVLRYSRVVLALGSRVVAPYPTRSRHALALESHDAALALSRELAAAAPGTRVSVLGGGLTALELASEIAEAHPRLSVRIVCDQLAPQLPQAARAALDRALSALSVEVREGVRIAELCDDAVLLADGERLATELAVVASGFRPALPSWLSAFARAEDGRLRVDAALRVLGEPDVFAAGDLAHPPASSVGTGRASTRMGCVTAMPLGAHAADVLSEGLPRSFHFDYPGQNVSLGRRRALVLFTSGDDLPTGRFLEGRLAALVKELVCRYVLAALRFEARALVPYMWPGMRARGLPAMLERSA